MKYDPKIIDDYIKSIDYYNFQDFCDRLLLTLYPNEYTPVRAGGRHGDMKNDGYCVASRIFFQCHASRGESAKQIKKKIQQDLEGCVNKWNDISKFTYITNDTLIGEIENFVDELRKKFPEISIETWSNKKLSFKIRNLDIQDIEFIIDRKIVPEITIIESEFLNAKYLLTNEFDFIKSISDGDLSDFPFENPILLENECLKFLRSLVSNQTFRRDGVENPTDLSESNYTDKYPDSKNIPNNDEEYRFFYHERIPNMEEIKRILKDDGVSQYLVNNGVPTNKISKINTCYESECDGAGKFQELFILRPLYAQFLVIKNISNTPIKLESLDSIVNNGVLYFQDSENELSTRLPNFLIEPQQNVVILIGLFLSDFKKIKEINSQIVTSHYVPEQIQELSLGDLENNPSIEFIGKSFSPRKIYIQFRGENYSYNIHNFSMNNVYWINRHWMCGSCPHLFFINNIGDTIYRGEIFNVSPNHDHLETIEIPNEIKAVIIAELEKETTQIDYILTNNIVTMTDITLIENEFLKLQVFPMDKVVIKGKYYLDNETTKKLSLIEKHQLIERFKKNYAQQAFGSMAGSVVN